MARNYWKKPKQSVYKSACKKISPYTRINARINAKIGARANARITARNVAGIAARIAGRITAVLIFILFAYGAVKLGIAGGNYIYENGFKIIEKIDAEKFKSVINSALPIIDVTYNSGSVANPFTAQVKKFLRILLGFDLNNPVTILNTEASYFYLYYKNNYLPKLALYDKKERNEDIDSDNAAGRDLQMDSRRSIDSDYGSGAGERRTTGESKKDGSGNDGGGDGNNYENTDEGRITFYYYEGEEEKLGTPEESITIGQEIKIQNMTKYKIDIEALLKEPLDFNFSRSGPKILVYHTHTTESFIKNIGDLNKQNIPNWSLNPEESVVRVGYELAELLRKKYGHEVLHNGTVHDYPNYDEAYNNAYQTLNSYLKSYPSIKVILDIHRDGLSKNQPKLRLATKVDGKDTAKIMFVVGTDARSPEHANWRENLKFALKLQENLNRQHPGLARHIYISNNVYNQNLSTGALIIEIGGDGNLLSECLESVKYLAKAIHEVIGQ